MILLRTALKGLKKKSKHTKDPQGVKEVDDRFFLEIKAVKTQLSWKSRKPDRVSFVKPGAIGRQKGAGPAV